MLRDLVGFGLGGIVAAIIAGVSLVMVYPISPDVPGRPNYGPLALTMTSIIAFFCGGFIGRRAFSANFWREMLPPVIASYAVMGFLWFISNADFGEAAPMVGFVSIGVVVSGAALRLLARRFPPKTESHDA
jgi:hypothetical protein